MSTNRRMQVLAALKAAGDATVSGEELAFELGVSRAAIAKHVAHLRSLGYVIDAAPGTGYHLANSTGVLTAEEVHARVTSPLVSRIVGGGVTTSTNDDAKKLAAAGVPEIAVAIAAAQTAGRGRLGRTWESPPGGLYASFLLRPELAVSELTSLPLVVGVGAARGLSVLGVDVGLKWPNDLLFNGGKVAGTLLELAAEADRAQWVVAGIGVNVSRSEGFVPGAAYLADVLPDPGLPAVAAVLVDGVAGAYADFLDGGFEALRREYYRHDVLRGVEVSVRGADGGALAEGRVRGVDHLGRLVLDRAEGQVAVASGDVTIRRL